MLAASQENGTIVKNAHCIYTVIAITVHANFITILGVFLHYIYIHVHTYIRAVNMYIIYVHAYMYCTLQLL